MAHAAVQSWHCQPRIPRAKGDPRRRRRGQDLAGRSLLQGPRTAEGTPRRRSSCQGITHLHLRHQRRTARSAFVMLIEVAFYRLNTTYRRPSNSLNPPLGSTCTCSGVGRLMSLSVVELTVNTSCAPTSVTTNLSPPIKPTP